MNGGCDELGSRPVCGFRIASHTTAAGAWMQARACTFVDRRQSGRRANVIVSGHGSVPTAAGGGATFGSNGSRPGGKAVETLSKQPGVAAALARATATQ